MVKRLLDFLNASPVNFLAAKNIASELEQAGYRRLDPQKPIGEVQAGDKLYVTKNDSSVLCLPHRTQNAGRCRLPHDLCSLRLPHIPYQAQCRDDV